jgi:hypothetical protein
VSDWPAPRNREQWKAEVRDRWVPWLNDLPVGTTVLGNNGAYWTRVQPPAQSMPQSGWWMSGPNRVGVATLVRLYDDFVVVDDDNYPLDEPAPPPKVDADRYSVESEVELADGPDRLLVLAAMLAVVAIMLVAFALLGWPT